MTDTAPLRNPLHVPGVMRCAKCSFQLHRTNLYMVNGTAGPGNNETEPFPNGCGPLWPVTWEQEAREGYKMSEDLFDRAKRAEDALRELVALEDMRLRLRSLHERGHGTDYEHYHKGLPKAWDAARALLAMLTKEQQAEAISKAREALGHNDQHNQPASAGPG